MKPVIGIRREDKNKWERRVPLIPVDLKKLHNEEGLQVLVQPSQIRIFTDDEYRKAGVTVQEDLDAASIVFAVKEIPIPLFKSERTYVFFAHVIKGQEQNMPLLKRLMDLRCSLIDYERIVDEKGRRLIFFGVHAGYAGMIETLRGLGHRLAAKGVTTPFADVKHAYEYKNLEDGKNHLRKIGERIRGGELPDNVRPLIFGIAGYGNVSRGAQEILDCLPIEEVPAVKLEDAASRRGSKEPSLLKVVFKEEDMVRPAKAGTTFELQDYYKHPEKYVGRFNDYLPHLDVLVNTAYWDERYPRLVTKEWTKQNYGSGSEPRLQVIGDISCDIDGGVELTVEATTPDAPCAVYNPASGSLQPGHKGAGPVLMAVDNLPCELARESSEDFSKALREMVVPLVNADWKADFEKLTLPKHLKDSVIVHKGELTPSYKYLEKHLL